MRRYIKQGKINAEKHMLNIKIKLKVIEETGCLTSLVLNYVKRK